LVLGKDVEPPASGAASDATGAQAQRAIDSRLSRP
jgi:hypothetical protein